MLAMLLLTCYISIPNIPKSQQQIFFSLICISEHIIDNLAQETREVIATTFRNLLIYP